ncbi:MAG: hypothetical protein HY901_12900 [Deltaproteobacteria bacterium]|nr:hypothetical protein [Deltaproteobacteria bacterium]
MRALGQSLPAAIAAAVCIAAGWAWGLRARWDYCSDPECNGDLEPSMLACPRCGGTIAGEISDPSRRPLDEDDEPDPC